MVRKALRKWLGKWLEEKPVEKAGNTKLVAAERLGSTQALGQESLVNVEAIPPLRKVKIVREDIHSVINVGMKVSGDVTVCRGLWIAGDVAGNVASLAEEEGLSLIIVGREGVVTGDVRAEIVVIYGKVNGNIYSNHIVATESATINGDVNYTTRMTVHDGASVNGRLNHVRQQPSAATIHGMGAHEPPKDLGRENAGEGSRGRLAAV